jgi:hypothetical protein
LTHAPAFLGRPTIPDFSFWTLREESKRQQAEAAGKRFQSYARRRDFPKEDVRNFIKVRSRAITLYDIEPWLERRPHKVIFEA